MTSFDWQAKNSRLKATTTGEENNGDTLGKFLLEFLLELFF